MSTSNNDSRSALPSSSQPSVLVDALPYIDQGYDDPSVKETVFKMIEDEMKRYKPTKNYLEPLPPIDLTKFETPLLKKEMERIASGQRMPMISLKRYDVPAPRSNVDVKEWIDAVDNSAAQLENLQIRITNLQLMNNFGTEAWKVYNTVLSSMLDNTQKQLNDLKKHIQDINWQRKSSQTVAGEKLKTLESTWSNLVSKNFEIERACVLLEYEIYQLEQKVKSEQQPTITATNGPNTVDKGDQQ